MKTILNKGISTLKMLTAALIILIFSSCTKETKNHCEEWEVTDEYSIIGACTFCGGTNTTLTQVFCGDSLKDAIAGNTIVLSDDGCCRLIRTFQHLIRTL